MSLLRIVLVAVIAVLLLSNACAPAPQPFERRHIQLPGRTDDLPYSDGVLVGDTVFLAGKIGIDPETGRPPEDIREEARLAMERVKATLAEAGMTMEDLVTVQVFCSDVSLYDDFNAVYRTFFSDSFPARAFIGSGTLLREGHFEVQGIAVRRQ